MQRPSDAPGEGSTPAWADADGGAERPSRTDASLRRSQTCERNQTFPVQNGKAIFSVTGVGTTSPDCSPPMTLRYSNVTVTVSGDSFDPDLVFSFPGTF